MITARQLFLMSLSSLACVLLLSCGGQSADDRYDAGLALMEQGQWEEAIIELEAASEEFDTNAGYRRLNGDFDEAREITAKNVNALTNVSVARTELGQHQLALNALNSAVYLDDKFAPSYAKRAVAHTRLGRDAEAEKDIAKATELGYDAAQLMRDIEAAKNAR